MTIQNFGQTLKSNTPLVVGLLLPVLMILFVAGSIYLPGFGEKAQPKYDFLYGTDVNYGPGEYQYFVRGGKLVREKNPDYNLLNAPGSPSRAVPVKAGIATGTATDTARFYVHDVKKNESREITFEEAAKFTLESDMKSPDGFEIRENYGGGSIFTEMFGGYRDNNYGKRYLMGNGNAIELNLKDNMQPYGYASFQFFGWVITEGAAE